MVVHAVKERCPFKGTHFITCQCPSLLSGFTPVDLEAAYRLPF